MHTDEVPNMRRWNMEHATCHIRHTSCRMPRATCHTPHACHSATCHMLHATRHISRTRDVPSMHRCSCSCSPSRRHCSSMSRHLISSVSFDERFHSCCATEGLLVLVDTERSGAPHMTRTNNNIAHQTHHITSLAAYHIRSSILCIAPTHVTVCIQNSTCSTSPAHTCDADVVIWSACVGARIRTRK